MFADYGKGVNKYNEVKGKTFGAGYEVFILAFFIGLYSDQKKPLIEDASKVKQFGWPYLIGEHKKAALAELNILDSASICLLLLLPKQILT